MGIASGVKGVVMKGSKVLVLIKPNGELDLPGGRVEESESYVQSLYREVLEETGLKIGILTYIAFWRLSKTPDLIVEGRTYACICLGGRLKLSQEHSGYRWVSYRELMNHVFKVPYLGSSGYDAQHGS
jgi:8-oxo-dGTP diphosphatase